MNWNVLVSGVVLVALVLTLAIRAERRDRKKWRDAEAIDDKRRKEGREHDIHVGYIIGWRNYAIKMKWAKPPRCDWCKKYAKHCCRNRAI